MKEPNVKANNAEEIHVEPAPDMPLREFGGYRATQGQETVDSLGSLRRQTLVGLRWSAVFGQSLALIVVSLVLGFEIPILACCLVILASAIVNITVTVRMPLDRRVSDFEAYMQLGFDLWQLAGLLWLTGGIVNPFSILFLAPVVTASTTLSRWVVFALGVMALMLSFGLVFYHHPLPWSPAGSFDLPLVLKIGIWTAICVGASFTSLYAWRMRAEKWRLL